MELNLLTLEETATLRNLLSHATHIVICAHKSPDGDAIGSSLAWMHYLKQTGKTDVRVCMPDATPDFLHWLPGHNSVIRYDRRSRDGQSIACVGLQMMVDEQSGCFAALKNLLHGIYT